MKSSTYKVTSKVWKYPGMDGWYFVGLGKKESADIKERFSQAKRGFGSIPVTVTVGQTSWDTSIFPDKQSGTYLLPLKAQIRKKEKILGDAKITYTVVVRPNLDALART